MNLRVTIIEFILIISLSIIFLCSCGPSPKPSDSIRNPLGGDINQEQLNEDDPNNDLNPSVVVNNTTYTVNYFKNKPPHEKH